MPPSARPPAARPTTSPPRPSTAARDRVGAPLWVAGLWSVVAGFMTITLLRSWQVGIPLRDPHGEVLLDRLALSATIGVVLVLVDAVLRTDPPRLRPRAWWDTLRVRWDRARIALVVQGLLAYHLVYFCYHNLKSWDVFNQPRDHLLLSWDRSLFLGHTPAVLLHDLLGQHVAAYLLMVVYESFSTIVSISFVAALVLPDRVRDGYVFIASMVCVWILGVASYYAIPSLGPFWSAPHVFAGLPHTMVQDTQARYLAQRAHLLAHPHAADSFAQVSAFASLHIGVTTVILLMVRYYRMRLLAGAMTVFLVLTVVATIYLGWHFALDDVAGLLLGWVSVRTGRWLVRGGARRSTA